MEDTWVSRDLPVLVTHVLDPATDVGLGRQITTAMRESRMLYGWVALQA